MPAFVTEQFRILNTTNFVNSIDNGTDNYYIFVGLPNPTTAGFGRSSTWDIGDPNVTNPVIPDPTDNIDYLPHYANTMLYGRKVTPSNVRRCIRRIPWTKGIKYDMYRHDYSSTNLSPNSNRPRLYDSDYYVINSQYQVYICISNGSTGTDPTGNESLDEPTFTDLEPSKAGTQGDGYIWKYLFSVLPSDIVKFDSTEFIPLPNDWDDTSTNAQVQAIRNNADSRINKNQIKKVFIERSGPSGAYLSGEVDIIGDGSGGRVYITVNESGQIEDATVTSGGSGYTYAIVDLEPLRTTDTFSSDPAKLIPIIPPSFGHGYDLYRELGAEKVFMYVRMDDSTKDFPTDTKFAQIGVLKNPLKNVSNSNFTDDSFNATYSLKVTLPQGSVSPVIGTKIRQKVPNGEAEAYIASYDSVTGVLKYFQDRSLQYSLSTNDQSDYAGISSSGKLFQFEGSNPINGDANDFVAYIDTSFDGSELQLTDRVVNLGSSFISGVSQPEINKTSGDIIFIDNRALVTRNSRQKEDIKIVLEF